MRCGRRLWTVRAGGGETGAGGVVRLVGGRASRAFAKAAAVLAGRADPLERLPPRARADAGQSALSGAGVFDLGTAGGRNAGRAFGARAEALSVPWQHAHEPRW